MQWAHARRSDAHWRTLPHLKLRDDSTGFTVIVLPKHALLLILLVIAPSLLPAPENEKTAAGLVIEGGSGQANTARQMQLQGRMQAREFADARANGAIRENLLVAN